jgi:hypothetical protein
MSRLFILCEGFLWPADYSLVASTVNPNLLHVKARTAMIEAYQKLLLQAAGSLRRWVAVNKVNTVGRDVERIGGRHFYS